MKARCKDTTTGVLEVVLEGADIHKLFAEAGIDSSSHRTFDICTETNGSGGVLHGTKYFCADRLVLRLQTVNGKPR